MQLIPCPFCGLREEIEFTYGRAAEAIPGDVQNSGSETDYVYLRSNPKGFSDELWQHTSGCRAWIRIRRHTATHEIVAGKFAHEKLDGHL